MTTSPRLIALLGTTALASYLAIATGLVPSGSRLALYAGFAIGPIAIVGILRLLTAVQTPSLDPPLRVARLFLVTGFILFTVMVVLQQMILLQFQGFLAAATDPASRNVLRSVFGGVNLVQLGLDVAFDLFYSLGVMMLAIVLYRHPAFGRFIGITGVASAGGLLTLNLLAFPTVPAESGLVDLGPVTAIWWLVVIVVQLRRGRTMASRRPPATA